MTTLPETKKLLLELEQGWLTIWFSSPENRNALSGELVKELMQTLDAVRDDRTVRGITLRGKGGIFCAGGDLKAFSALQSGTATHDSMAALNKSGGEMFDAVMSMPQVVIAYVEGAAIAGGLGLMCCADIIVVQRDAKFSLTETMIGIVPAQIAPIIVGRAGLPVARKLMLTGAKFIGAQTPDIGLSDYVVSNADAFADIETDIKRGVRKCAPGAVGLTKDILRNTPKMTRNEQIDYAADKFAEAILSEEGMEGISSFVTKRKPKWAEE